MKRTKIIATLGPAVDSKTTIEKLGRAGVNVFRINMSHGDHAQWKRFIKHARSTCKHAAILMDTKGPELRLMGVKQDFGLRNGDEMIVADKMHKKLPYISHSTQLKKGMTVLIDDGAITATVKSHAKGIITLKIIDGGVVTNKRKVTLPGHTIDFPILSSRDRKDLHFAKKQGVEAIALSFTRSAKDVKAARRVVGKDILIIAKIENHEGVRNINEIIDAADGIMVARGDLGVEIPLEEVPPLQKRIIGLCNHKAKPVIVATQMLESMTVNNRPTRAEASDVANAVLDGVDCLMLSGETAMGKYPVEAVKVMTRIAAAADESLQTGLARLSQEKIDVAEAISNAVFDLSLNLHVDAIVTATSSGFTARMVARFRPQIPIIGVAHDEKTKRQLEFTWGVTPIVFRGHSGNGHRTILHAVRSAYENKLLRKKDHIIATAGVDTKQTGSTNLIEVHNVGELLSVHQ